MNTPDNIPADVREAIRKTLLGYAGSTRLLKLQRPLCTALAPFFAAKDAEIADLRRKHETVATEYESAMKELVDRDAALHSADKQIADLRRQLDEAQRRLGEVYGQFSGAEATITRLNVDLYHHHGMALRNIARAKTAEKRLANATNAIAMAVLSIDAHETENLPKWLRGVRNGLRAAMRQEDKT